MKEIDRSKPVLVTGGGGYIASWIIQYLLEDGISVRATVRDKLDSKKISHLLRLSERFPGKLELYEADLLKEGSFLNAIQEKGGVELILHTASPFFIDKIKDPQKELVEPAVFGTKNVLESANASPSVKRIVLTSSVAAVMGDNIEVLSIPNHRISEKNWNTTSSLTHQPYPYSKTLAEQEAWKIADAQSKWDLITINPSFVMGPSVSDRADGTSVNFMLSMINGKYAPGVPDIMIGFVDVRDVAKAHILAGFTPSAKGRHIVSAIALKFLDVAKMIREKYGNRFPTPKTSLPKFLTYLIGPFFGLSWPYISRNVGFSFEIDHSYSKKDLGLNYRPISETFVEHIEQILSSKML
ncbi:MULTISPECIES: NAD-dependent epimerase/dehydratase family protein [Leptospira]|uniref:3-beta hydroxysteroid dehydrogenase/isomerase family protein n=4 Tax=Leptospira borgpetersenii TaxID=174 RepID=M3GCD3_LEPBO|nr:MULTISPECIES: NAD-dependent epimerase/dehydratase family protein [Leptospira]EMF98566.1 3-beta hydroxysteroid dehydrogenase/isomerase family protein [Leptospira borgpetersenii str. 200701203]AXX16930.1 diaminohydroxyphosphoribosylaminopyrimidine deaminase [Leptospira borgpetersenii serovar Ceylonica]EKP12890.1 3-beta hydroxysteroid dehydrogenase/isomerase family protein [Leptospira borgpetersenii str. 200801926]EKQ93898.1 3-beta hydroxysteroid dehydrogenase/isomerase family protein [Leptospi